MGIYDEKNACLRQIPSVESILSHDETKERLSHVPRWVLIEGIRKILDQKRKRILSEENQEKVREVQISVGSLLNEIEQYLQSARLSELGRVINGTGVILHTNLGRAVLAREAAEKVSTVIKHYSNLEFDLLTGKRGKRGNSVIRLLRQITGAEDAVVVNNNAAAVLLTLNTLAKSREVIVSRGELVEIGGSFRIPEVLRAGGAQLVEVGTTNKTRLKDYQEAITPESAAILKVHPSNYRIVGFTEEVSLPELIHLGHARNLLVIYDLGSGMLIDLSPYGLHEPVVTRLVGQGPDIITFSGDKLMGGPQAGIILGKQKLARALRENPLIRALRPDKMTLACMENTLQLYREPDVLQRIPVLRMITEPRESLEEKGKQILGGLLQVPRNGIRIEITDDTAEVGGGAFPALKIPSVSLAISLHGEGIDQLAEWFRLRYPPIIGRICQNQFRLNLRTIQEDDIPEIIQSIIQIMDHWKRGEK